MEELDVELTALRVFNHMAGRVGWGVSTVAEASAIGVRDVFDILRVAGRSGVDMPEGGQGAGLYPKSYRDTAGYIQRGTKQQLNELAARVGAHYINYVDVVTRLGIFAAWAVETTGGDISNLTPQLSAVRARADREQIKAWLQEASVALNRLKREAAELDEATFLHLLHSISWVHEAEAARKAKRVAQLSSSGQSLAGAVPHMRVPSDVRSITQGQLLRLCDLKNLPQGNITRAQTRAYAEKLDELGIDALVDTLKPSWQVLVIANREDMFWDGVERMLAGDLDWRRNTGMKVVADECIQ